MAFKGKGSFVVNTAFASQVNEERDLRILAEVVGAPFI